MSSPLLALFVRSVREDTRTRTTYIARFGLVLVILLFLATVSGSFGWGNAPGLRFFSTVVFINFGFIVLAGFSHFASAITEEKEEMTLGLLRMTNLNALSILLGKSTSRILHALLLLAAQFPFTLLAISLGGVATRQVVAAYCTLGAFVIFVANLALLGSVLCRRSTGAAVFTGLTLGAVYAALPFFYFLLTLPQRFAMIRQPSAPMSWFGSLVEMVNLTSPLRRLSEILSTGFSDSPLGVQVWSNLALGLVCFLLAWALFEKFCSEQREASQPRSLVARRTGRLRFFSAGRTWRAALAWKDFHFITGGKTWMAIKFILYAIPTALFLLLNRRWSQSPVDWEVVGGFTAWIASLIIGIEVAFLAASVLRHERRYRTLSSLAMLPMSLRRIAYQKFLGCLPSLLPAVTYGVLGAALVVVNLKSPLEAPDFDSRALIPLFYVFAQGLLFLHLTVTLSLHLRRGGLPAAIALQFVANLFAGIIMAAAREMAVMLVLALACLVGSAILHVHIGRRLERLAEED